MPRALLALPALALWLSTANAAACPNCAGANEGGRVVYYIATGLMLSVPLILIGALSFWLMRRANSKANPR